MSTNPRRQQQKELRAARKEAERKAAARQELTRRVRTALGLGVAVAIVLLVASVLSGDDGELSPDYEAFRAQPTACGAEQPPAVSPVSFEAPESREVAPESTATIETSCGPIVVALDPTGAPETVSSFAFLADRGFYDGVVFHRIVDGFVVQAGDPTASGNGNPGYRLPDEFPPADFPYTRGVVAMANAGRGTTGSQFFIVVGDAAASLPPTFNVIGEVVDGFDALDAIAAVPTGLRPNTTERSLPTESVYITGIDISSPD